MSNYKILQEKDNSFLKKYVHFAWDVYNKDKKWIPPIIDDQINFLSGKDVYFDRTKHQSFMLCNSKGKIYATISGFIEEGKPYGAFGFFESLPGSGKHLSQLFEKMERWFYEHNVKKIIGPLNGPIYNKSGLLLHLAKKYPAYDTAYNPLYYASLLEQNGFQTEEKYCAFEINFSGQDTLEKIDKEVNKIDTSLSIVPFNPVNKRKGFKLYKDLLDAIFKDLADYSPLDDMKFFQVAENMIRFIEPDMLSFVYHEKQPIGFILYFPDYASLFKEFNGVRKKQNKTNYLKTLKYDRAVVVWGGIIKKYRKKGVVNYVAARILKQMKEKGFASVWLKDILENNLLSQIPILYFSGEKIATYAIYGKQIVA